MKSKKIIDLFSGAGGLTEGFNNNNFNIIGHVERDAAASETLKLRDSYHYLDSNKLAGHYIDFLNKKISLEELYNFVPVEIKNKVLNIEINDKNLPVIFKYFDKYSEKSSIDGIIGGPPCQAYSTIGRARNAVKKSSDERIYLYKYYIEFLKRYKPEFFVFENVKGLLSFKDVDGDLLYPKMKNEFEESGYALEYEVLNAADYGVPQNRERIIIFGVKKKNSKLITTFFDKLNMISKERNSVRDAFQDLPEMIQSSVNNQYKSNAKNELTHFYRKNKAVPLTQNVSRPNNDNDLKIYKIVAKAKEKGVNIKYSDLDSNLITHKHIDKFLDRYKALSWDNPSHTVVAHIAKDGHHYIHPDINQNRSITVREAARLQGFPDDYYFLNSRTNAFTQIGNAVPPMLSNKIATVISELSF